MTRCSWPSSWSAQLKNSQEGKTNLSWSEELVTHLLELMGYPWIDSPLRIILMGLG